MLAAGADILSRLGGALGLVDGRPRQQRRRTGSPVPRSPRSRARDSATPSPVCETPHWAVSALPPLPPEASPRSNAVCAALAVPEGGAVAVGASRDEGLRALCWRGCPEPVRGECWRLLCGYLPPTRSLRELRRKRMQYLDHVCRYYDPGPAHQEEHSILRQIRLDLPRTLPAARMFQCAEVMRRMERILYIWAVRHPATGYVQGINDIFAPYFAVFAAEEVPLAELLGSDPGAALQRAGVRLDAAEADAYWCASCMLDSVQDNYTFAQPGIQRMTRQLGGLVERVDAELHEHLHRHGAEFLQFAFRWMNCLLVRELPLRLVLRLWDTYLAEGDGFRSLHVYVCCAMLLHFAPELRARDFTEMMMFLQSIGDRGTRVQDVELWISQAYVMQQRYEATSHVPDGPAAL